MQIELGCTGVINYHCNININIVSFLINSRISGGSLLSWKLLGVPINMGISGAPNQLRLYKGPINLGKKRRPNFYGNGAESFNHAAFNETLFYKYDKVFDFY